MPLIPGAIGISYVLQPEDVGYNIFCRVRGTNAAGFDIGQSNTVGPVLSSGPPPAISVAPEVTVSETGMVLTSDTGTWTNSPTSYAYQWYSDEAPDVAIGGATSATYVIDGGVIVPFVATTFDPANKSANVTLSGGDLTATLTSDSRGGARSIASADSPAKKYFEVTVNAVTTPAGYVIGIANAANGVDSFPGSSNDGVGVAGNGQIYINNGVVGAVAAYAAGDRIGIAIDFTIEQMWFRKNGGAWHSGDVPGGAVPGLDFSSTNAGPYYVLISQFNNADACTANFGPSFTDTAPSGYGSF